MDTSEQILQHIVWAVLLQLLVHMKRLYCQYQVSLLHTYCNVLKYCTCIRIHTVYGGCSWGHSNYYVHSVCVAKLINIVFTYEISGVTVLMQLHRFDTVTHIQCTEILFN